jgi:hypothetical protein
MQVRQGATSGRERGKVRHRGLRDPRQHLLEVGRERGSIVGRVKQSVYVVEDVVRCD